jgi:hypothetical protein
MITTLYTEISSTCSQPFVETPFCDMPHHGQTRKHLIPDQGPFVRYRHRRLWHVRSYLLAGMLGDKSYSRIYAVPNTSKLLRNRLRPSQGVLDMLLQRYSTIRGTECPLISGLLGIYSFLTYGDYLFTRVEQNHYLHASLRVHSLPVRRHEGTRTTDDRSKDQLPRPILEERIRRRYGHMNIPVTHSDKYFRTHSKRFHQRPNKSRPRPPPHSRASPRTSMANDL